jgi:hypothetical protein
MEVAGYTVGVAGLAGLFSACLDTIDHVDSYRRFGVESRDITAQLNADKVLVRKWAEKVGVVDDKLNIANCTDLDRAEVVAAVERILSSIYELRQGHDWVCNHVTQRLSLASFKLDGERES